MIWKLMKYDIKKMSRVLWIIYVITLGLAGITRFINIWSDIQAVKIIGGVFAGFAYSALVSVLVNTFVHILRVFIIGFYKDESYLTHTLPVSRHQLLASKYLSSIVVVLSSILVCFASLFIMLYSKSFTESLKEFISVTVSGFNMSAGMFIALMVLIIFAQICSLMSMAFASIVKANTYNEKRVMKGLLWFFAFYFGSMMTTVVIAIIAFAFTGNLSELLATTLSQSAFITILIIGLVAYVLYSIAFYIICDRWFKKGVNVD